LRRHGGSHAPTVVVPASAFTRPLAHFAIHEVLDLVRGASPARVLVR
jgi:hypothetical protein